MDLNVYFLCVSFSFVLKVLFVLTNYPYYRVFHGEKANRIVIRTVVLNTVAILIGWAPVVHLWPFFSKEYLFPFVCAMGALSCVASRFIYPEVVPEQVGKTLLRLLERERDAQPKETAS